MEKLGWEKYLQDYLLDNKSKMSPRCYSYNSETKKYTAKERGIKAVAYAKNLFKKIRLFVLLGVGIGAFLHGYVPQEFFTKYMNADNLFAVPLAVIAGIPLYSDITAIVPIAKVLLEKDAAVGTVLVFMMSIVTLSLPELIIISRVMKTELIIRFAIFMFAVFTMVGYLYNLIL